jgi:hypothetical protein
VFFIIRVKFIVIDKHKKIITKDVFVYQFLFFFFASSLFGLLDHCGIQKDDLGSITMRTANALREHHNWISNNICDKRNKVKNNHEAKLNNLDSVTTNRNVLKERKRRRE